MPRGETSRCVTVVAREHHRLVDGREFSNADLAVVASKAPDAVVCLISAPSFHGITTQVPRTVYLAVSRGRYAGLRLSTPPVKIYRFDAATFDQGIETHQIDGVAVHIYGVARTLVDCFKYRNKLGLDIAIEALRFARERKRTSNRWRLALLRGCADLATFDTPNRVQRLELGFERAFSDLAKKLGWIKSIPIINTWC
jgi:predicted transcriptional regulator of viral defense system